MKQSMFECAFYVAIGAGIALSTTSFLLVSALFMSGSITIILPAILFACGLCLWVAKAIGNLARRFPTGPGIRTYTKAAFGNHVSLFLTYSYISVLFLVAGVESYLFSKVIVLALPGFPSMSVVLLVFLSVTLINIRGLQMSARTQIFLAFSLLTVLVVTGSWGLYFPTAHMPGPDVFLQHPFREFSIVGLFSAVAIAVFLFVGFEWIAPVGMSREAYEKKIPISMCVAVLVNAAVYVIFILGIGHTLPSTEIATSEVPQVAYFASLTSGYGKYLALGVSFVAVFTTFNAGIIGGARILYFLAREKRLPPFLASIHSRHGSPHNAIIFVSTLGIASACLTAIMDLAIAFMVVSSIVFCLVYSSLLASHIRLSTLDANLPIHAKAVIRIPQYFAAAMLVFIALGSLLELNSSHPEGFIVLLVIALVSIGLASKYTTQTGQSNTPVVVNGE